MSSQSTARGTVRLLIGRGVFMASGYVITVILARGLGPVAYGAYGLVMSLLLWLEVASDAGLQRATIKLIPESTDGDAVAHAAIALLLSVSVVLLVVCWIAAPWVAAALEIEGGAWLFRLAVLDLPFNGLYLAYQGTLQGRRHFGTLSLTLVVYSLAKVGGITALLFVGVSVEAALIVNVLATIAALAYLFKYQRPQFVWPSRALRERILKVAAPLGISVVTMQLLLQVHLWSLKRLGGVPNEIIGLYVAALNLARLPTIVPFVLTGVVLASISTALARQDNSLAARYVQAAGRLLLVILLPICVLGGVDATPIMVFVFSEDYAGGGTLLALLLVAFGLFSVLDTLLHAMIADGLQVYVMAGLLALVPVELTLNALMIPAYGAIGAAAALTIALGIGTLAAVLWSTARFGGMVKLLTLARIVLAAAVTALAGTQLDVSGIWLLPKLAGLLILYGLILVVLRELGPRDFQSLVVWQKE